jgi:hypothetical protein
MPVGKSASQKADEGDERTAPSHVAFRSQGSRGRLVVDMRLGIRTVPWLIAAASLGIPLLAGGFAGWPYVVLWGMLLIVPWIVTREQPASRRERMKLPAFLLPVLFLLGFVGGWYLIPADVAWLLVEFADKPGTDGVPRRAAS